MAAVPEQGIRDTPTRIPLPQWNSKTGGRQEGAGRPRLYGTSRGERDIRVYIPRDLHEVWVKLKGLSGCRTDRHFTKFLLDLAEKHL